MNRRGFFGAIAALAVSPAIAKLPAAPGLEESVGALYDYVKYGVGFFTVHNNIPPTKLIVPRALHKEATAILAASMQSSREENCARVLNKAFG